MLESGVKLPFIVRSWANSWSDDAQSLDRFCAFSWWQERHVASPTYSSAGRRLLLHSGQRSGHQCKQPRRKSEHTMLDLGMITLQHQFRFLPDAPLPIEIRLQGSRMLYYAQIAEGPYFAGFAGATVVISMHSMLAKAVLVLAASWPWPRAFMPAPAPGNSSQSPRSSRRRRLCRTRSLVWRPQAVWIAGSKLFERS